MSWVILHKIILRWQRFWLGVRICLWIHVLVCNITEKEARGTRRHDSITLLKDEGTGRPCGMQVKAKGRSWMNCSIHLQLSYKGVYTDKTPSSRTKLNCRLPL